MNMQIKANKSHQRSADMTMKYRIELASVLLFFSISAGAAEFQSSEAVVGWGVEYRFGKTQNKFDFYAFSQSDFHQGTGFTKYSYREAKRTSGLSCVPDEGDPDGQCSVGWFGPLVYIIALPVSLHLYKEMFDIE